MPQINVGTSNITTFGYSVTFDILNRTITFNILPFTTGPGLANTKIAFSVVDSAGVVLASIDFTNPQIPNPSLTTTWVLDLTDSPYAFLFSSFSIIGAIQDQSGQVYSIQPLVKTVCMPNDFQEDGSVPGMFTVTPDCTSDSITVKEITVQIYNSLSPTSVSKSGNLYYPTGTISPVAFGNTPFSNNQVYTGQYRLSCTTYATYNLGNDFYVVVGYVTDQVFDINCVSKMSDLLCCLREVQQTAITNCDNAIGQRAKQLIQQVTVPFVAGMLAEFRGMDSTNEYLLVKKTLNCSCGNSSIGQNEVDPTNISVNTIVITGSGGTDVQPPTITGSTKNFVIHSNSYKVTKGVPSDPGLTIGLDNTVPNQVGYPITLNYLDIAQEIYTATANDPTTLNQLNALIQDFGLDISGLDGMCIIDLTKITYSLSFPANGSVGVGSIVINGNSYPAPALLATNASGIQSWLNSLSLGSWTATYDSGILTILSIDNTNQVATISFTNPTTVIQFGRTSKSIADILQAIISYLCGISALQIAVGNAFTICTLDYNGNIVSTPYQGDASQNDFNQAVSSALCNLASRIATLVQVTCSKIQSLFQDYPAAVFNNSSDRYLAIVGGNCTSLTGKQQALAFINMVNSDSDVKAAYCAIDCTIPGSCPDISGSNLNAVSNTSIGLYSINWNTPPSGVQSVTVKYRVTGSTTYNIAASSLQVFPNGNLVGSSPFVISGLIQNTQYDIFIQNTCGGLGFVKQVSTPPSSVSSGQFLLNNALYLICGSAPTTLYSAVPFNTGVTMYLDLALTMPVTGFLFIESVSSGHIFGLNSSTGVVGADTGNQCASGTPGTYILGNALGSICSGAGVTKYTNGAFAPTGVLYNDSALTSPVTGFVYVVNTATNVIYNLNSSTGVIGSSTGSNCTGTASLQFTFVNAGGSFLQFQATLNRAIDGNINISKVFADGFSDGACSVDVASAQKNTTMSILIGNTGVGSPPDGGTVTGSWASAIKYKMYNVIINGTPLVDGATITIGTYVVTVHIPACSS